MTLHGHPIARELENWWREHGGRPNDPQWKVYIETYLSLVRRKADELLTEHTNYGRFGMSKAGGCTRSAQLKALGHEQEPFSGSTLATFHIGHNVEVMAIATLIAAGYEITDLQMPLEIAPMMRSARDGTIKLDDKRTALSVKSMGYKKSGSDWTKGGKKWVRRGFPELAFEGIRVSQPGYWAQAQAEMHADGYEQALVLVVAKDMIAGMKDDPFLGERGNGSLTFYAELVPYNAEFVNKALIPAWTEAWSNVERGEVGRGLYIHKTADVYAELSPADPNGSKAALGLKWLPCDWCDMRAACDAASGADSILEQQLQASIELVRDGAA